ncbi:hypothetical protein C2G38_2118875, partial [Gigaspora rosea]
MVKNPEVKFNLKEFLEYLNKAAENNNHTAQYNLGEIYVYGRLKAEKDEKKGIQYLKLAALNNNLKAIKILNELKIDIYKDV